MGIVNICSGGLLGGVYTGDMQHTVGTPYMLVSFSSVLRAGGSEGALLSWAWRFREEGKRGGN